MEQSTPNKKIPVGLIAGLIAAALIVAAVGGYFGLCAWVQDNDQLLPGAVAVDDQGETVADLGKLTELGMLDENVNAEADMNRALVAALADNMIGVYVTADNIDDVTEGGVITGEQTGVIVVMPGVRVEIKDATVPAVVAQGGEVQLLGETTVDTVKVGGEYATVVAEEGTTIGAVTVGGENAKVELNGTVESVVVAADATEPEISGEGVTAEIVDNQSPVDVTVNGETLEGVPAEEPEKPEESTGEGFVPDQTKPAGNPSVAEDTDPDDPTIPGASAGKVEEAADPEYSPTVSAEKTEIPRK